MAFLLAAWAEALVTADALQMQMLLCLYLKHNERIVAAAASGDRDCVNLSRTTGDNRVISERQFSHLFSLRPSDDLGPR